MVTLVSRSDTGRVVGIVHVRSRRKLVLVIGVPLVTAIAIVTLLLALPTNSETNHLASQLLGTSDLPIGWTPAPTTSSYESTSAPCLSGVARQSNLVHVSAAFTQGPAVPSFSESLIAGTGITPFWANMTGALSRCRSASITIAGIKHKITIEKIPFQLLGTATSSYLWHFSASGIDFGVDLVVIKVGAEVAQFTYADMGTPLQATVAAFIDGAISKIEGHSGRVSGVMAVASTPVRIAHTNMGDVGYRILGRGPALVMVMGYAGTMETWDPRFVDDLAKHFRVVIFDNSGVGETTALRAPLTIDAMANQTSALIDTLHLSKVDVLGWSMGGMVAQALAVLHPSQVRRLVLCATFPGVGHVVKPSQVMIDALTNSKLPQSKTVLFPANRSADLSAFLLAVSRYPNQKPVSAVTIKSQGSAVIKWWNGDDPAAQKTRSLRVPTLVADGSIDTIDPVANDRALAQLIPGAQLVLYADAGHAFLFQQRSEFVRRVVGLSATVG